MKLCHIVGIAYQERQVLVSLSLYDQQVEAIVRLNYSLGSNNLLNLLKSDASEYPTLDS